MKKRLFHHAQTYELVRAPAQLPTGLRMVFRTLEAAAAFVARVGHGPVAIQTLRSVLVGDFGHASAIDLSDDAVCHEIATLLATRQLAVYATAVLNQQVARTADDEAAADPRAAELAAARKTWIEIELLDMEGNPMPGRPYWIKLPDDTVREGRLNAQGRAYFGDLDPGNCVIRWPDLDDEAAIPAPPTATQPPVREKTWIEIELLDMEGHAVPRERYHVKLPDGSVREGRLDDQGFARFDQIDPGDCEIRWPDREEEALVTLDPAGEGAMTTEHLDAEAQAAALTQAAAEGVPFCAECERRRLEREAQELQRQQGQGANNSQAASAA